VGGGTGAEETKGVGGRGGGVIDIMQVVFGMTALRNEVNINITKM